MPKLDTVDFFSVSKDYEILFQGCHSHLPDFFLEIATFLCKGQRDSFWMAKNAILVCREKLELYWGKQVDFEWFWTTFGNGL